MSTQPLVKSDPIGQARLPKRGVLKNFKKEMKSSHDPVKNVHSITRSISMSSDSGIKVESGGSNSFCGDNSEVSIANSESNHKSQNSAIIMDSNKSDSNPCHCSTAPTYIYQGGDSMEEFSSGTTDGIPSGILDAEGTLIFKDICFGQEEDNLADEDEEDHFSQTDSQTKNQANSNKKSNIPAPLILKCESKVMNSNDNSGDKWQKFNTAGLDRKHSSGGTSNNSSTSSTITQHYYPEGEFGYVIVAAAFFSHALLCGMEFSFGILSVPLSEKFQEARNDAQNAGKKKSREGLLVR